MDDSTKSSPDPELVAKLLSGEFRIVEPSTQWQYAEIEFSFPEGWEPRLVNGSCASGIVGRVEGQKMVLVLKRRHQRGKKKRAQPSPGSQGPV